MLLQTERRRQRLMTPQRPQTRVGNLSPTGSAVTVWGDSCSPKRAPQRERCLLRAYATTL